MKKKKDKEDSPKRPWRENIESLVVAVVVALLLKSFVLEVSKIPSGSMQPTLMGSPAAGVFDRILVDKLSYQFRDPDRFEIVVFRHPIEHSRVMVKRLVGMPGEELHIHRGDLWTRPLIEEGAEPEPWAILRRPESVQAAAWRGLESGGQGGKKSWQVVAGGKGWRVEQGTIAAPGAGEVRFQNKAGQRGGNNQSDAIRDGYLDGYPQSVKSSIPLRNPAWGTNPVGDLRIAATIRAADDLAELILRLTEGDATYEFTVPGPRAAMGARPGIEVRRSGRAVGEAAAGETPWSLPVGDAIPFAVENLDDRLSLFIDGQVVASREVESARDQRSTASLVLSGGGADLDGLVLQRDVYYLPLTGGGTRGREGWRVAIPEGHYVMLGDNTQDSADSRDWRAVTFETGGDNGGDGGSVRGNWRQGGENPTPTEGPNGERVLRFRDEWGEMHWFTRDDARQGLPGGAPLVSRDLLQGRAIAVFWPIQPIRGLWRFGALH